MTYPGTVDLSAVLYVGCFEQNSRAMYFQSIAAPSFTAPGQPYLISVPDPANCFMIAVLDNDNNGFIDVGDVSNIDGNESSNTLQVSGAGPYSLNIALAGTSSVSAVTTSHMETSGANDSYSLSFDVAGGLKLPVAVQLVSGPNLLAPMDFAPSQTTSKGGRFQFSPSLINQSTRPNTSAPDTYVFTVWYSDGTSSDGTTNPIVSVPVTTVLDSFATSLAVDTTDGPATSVMPTFTWAAPAAPPAGGYTYQLSMSPQMGGNSIWRVPGDNANVSGLANSVLELIWGTDPTSGNNPPSPATLTSGTAYQWSIAVQDNSGNSAQEQQPYTPQ